MAASNHYKNAFDDDDDFDNIFSTLHDNAPFDLNLDDSARSSIAAKFREATNSSQDILKSNAAAFNNLFGGEDDNIMDNDDHMMFLDDSNPASNVFGHVMELFGAYRQGIIIGI